MPVLLVDVFRAASVGVSQPWTKAIQQTFGGIQSSQKSPIWLL
jgi:hypothetical protein